MSRWFAEAVDLGIMSVRLDRAGKKLETNVLEVFQRMQLRAQPSVNAEELLVHDGGQWQRAEGFHTGFVDLLGVLVLAFELEGEVVGQVTAFVVSS